MNLLDVVKEYVIHTPWYVYLILLYILYVGFKSLKGRTVPIRKMLVLPIIFIVMSVDEMTSSLPFSSLNLIVWLLGLLVGGYLLGWLPYQFSDITAEKDKGLLHIKGNWHTLVLLLLTFAVKYAVAVVLATHAHLSPYQIYALMLVSGLFTGAFVGRFVYALKVLRTGPYL